MPSREAFEQELRGFASAAHDNEDDSRAARALSEALLRLDQTPELRAGDPEGVFSYEDPILAAAAREYLFPSSPPQFHGQHTALTSANWLTWAAVAVGIVSKRLGNDPDLVDWAAMVPDKAIARGNDSLRLAVVGDAGYRSRAQTTVCRLISDVHRERPFDYVVHLGDIYFAGSEGEMLTNFLAPFQALGPQVLTLCGNHDLYCGAGPIKSVVTTLRQPGRYFAIETPRWRIICLDSSTGSQGLLRGDGLLDERQLRWLTELLRGQDGRRNILMSHHFTRSSWGNVSYQFDRQLDPLIQNRVLAWYWGHEHGCVAYHRDRLGFYGACVGNGAFLEKWSGPSKAPAPAWYAEGRCKCTKPGDERYWPHGFLELEFEADHLVETYHVEDGAGFTRQITPS